MQTETTRPITIPAPEPRFAQPEICGATPRSKAVLPISGVGRCYAIYAGADGEPIRCMWWTRLRCVGGWWLCDLCAERDPKERQSGQAALCRHPKLSREARAFWCAEPYEQGALEL